ncbi:MAG: hypothetical protein IJ460_06595 [Clostridia bacterium]|nr:hypothetical protein [Clostridia bacterium]
MKKQLLIILSTIMLLAMPAVFAQTNTAQYADSELTVYLDGAYVDVNNLMIDGTEYLPIKELCRLLGYNIAELSDNTYEITEGENCKNSEGTVKSVRFTLGEDYVTNYSKDGNYENKIEQFPSAPITVQINDEIYISSYYFGRMLEIKTRFTEDDKIALITLNEQNRQMANAPVYRGYLYVKNHDDKLELEVDNKELTFTDKPFIDSAGRTQVPVREFCEQLNASVMWNEESKTVGVSTVPPDLDKSNGGSAGGASFWFTIGEKQYRINGTYYEMDTEAQIINDRTYVPLRYLAEAMKYYVAYNPGSPAQLDIGYGYTVLNSYLGKDKEFVFDEMDIDESYMLKSDDESYPIREHEVGNMYIVKNGYKKAHVVLEFYNNILCAFQYVFKTEGEAFNEAININDYFIRLYGEPATYPGVGKTISGIGADESQFNEEVCSYYDEWNAEASSETVEALLGDVDNALMKMLKLDINPRMSVVRVNYTKDVNFHNKSVLKIMD